MYLRLLLLCQFWLKSVTKSVEGEGWEETKTQETGIVCHCTSAILLGNWRTVAKKQFFLRGFKSNCSNGPGAGLEKLNVWSLPYALHTVNLCSSHIRIAHSPVAQALSVLLPI